MSDLSFSVLKDLVDKFSPIPFVAFTCSPAGYAHVKSLCKQSDSDCFNPNIINGIEVYCVSKQKMLLRNGKIENC